MSSLVPCFDSTDRIRRRPLAYLAPFSPLSPLTPILKLPAPATHAVATCPTTTADNQNITAYVRGAYQSPAKTATHIHQAAVGRAGPPRLAFPNPVNSAGELGDDLELRYSYGCLKGPFTTGILANGTDTASGFTIKALEENPTGFFADTHTAEFVAGAVRGQLKVVKSDKKKHW